MIDVYWEVESYCLNLDYSMPVVEVKWFRFVLKIILTKLTNVKINVTVRVESTIQY